jgi:hypothetical protein
VSPSVSRVVFLIKPAVVEQRQLDLLAKGADIGFGKQQLAGALPLLAHLPIL